MFCLLFIYSLYSLCIYLYVRKHLCSLLILLIYSFGPLVGLVKLTMCAKVCHVDERMFILLICQAYNASFLQKLDSVQYNAALTITGALRGTSKEKLYNEVSLETLEKKRWYRKLCCFFKICRYKCPKYLFNIIPTSVSTYNTRNTNNIPLFNVKQFISKFLFFLLQQSNGTNWTLVISMLLYIQTREISMSHYNL